MLPVPWTPVQDPIGPCQKYNESYPWSAGPVHIWDLSLVLTAPADALATRVARASAGTVRTTELE